MARILINGEWYYEVSATSYSEAQFEEIFFNQSEDIFPEFYVIPFKKTVESNHGTARADLAMVHKGFLSWWLIEVEMSHHSLYGHILPQVNILANAAYTDEIVQYMHQKDNRLPIDRLKSLIRGQQPRAIVVVDRPMEDWLEPLKRIDALLSIFQIFQSESGKNIYRLNGDYPWSPESDSSTCRVDKLIKRFVRVDAPGVLDVQPNEYIDITYEDRITKWQRLDIADQVYLTPAIANPLDANKKYILQKVESNKYIIKNT